MYRSPTSQDTRHDHLRDLLDQRSARADIQGRFSSAISEYTDTPSVYSRTNFSPRVLDHGGQDLYRGDFDGPEPISPYLSRSNDAHNRVHGHPISMVDLDTDSRFSPALSEKNDGEQPDYDAGEDEIEIETRMSYLGPKMRFHSRAPWEMEGDALEEEDDPDQASRHFQQDHLFGRSSGSKFDSSGSCSPRPSFNSRPSGESLYSQIPPKRSFETISSQMSYPRGALYALAQESLSTNSLARPALPKENKDTIRNKFSFGRLKPDPPAVSLPQSPIRGRFPISPGGHEQLSFKYEPHARSNNTYYANSTQESMHPYANPDLIVSYADDDTEKFASHNVQHPRNDSSITITESSSTDSMVKSSSRATLTPDTSVNSINSKHRASSILTKTISSPVPVLGPSQRVDSMASDTYSVLSQPPPVNNLAGWTERNTPPTFSLISLEEARAQRTRSSTVTVPAKISTLTSMTEYSTPFPSRDIEIATIDTIPTSRTRARSISAGAKAKNVIQTIVGPSKPEHRDSGSSSAYQAPAAAINMPGPKTLKHKKSGFMRLFNGGKTPEKEGHNSPPPVSSLPETVVPPQPNQRTPKHAPHRIPVPSLPSAFLEATTFENNVSAPRERESSKSDLSPKRTPPPTLSINTIPQGVASRSSTSNLLPIERPFLNEQPQSAPAHVSEFPALRLRPVSTLFSDHFRDHIVTGNSRSSDETTDLDTPRSPSPSGLMSPVTPASAFTSNVDKNQASLLSSEEQPKLKALQEEFESSKQAWQRHIWELEGQVRDLKMELAESKTKNTGDFCHSCGRGVRKEIMTPTSTAGSILNRPRARTGVSSRFGNALP